MTSKNNVNYKIEYWHTDREKWCSWTLYPIEVKTEADKEYQDCLEWHYAKTVRLVEITTAILKQSKSEQ